jgi:hypothetical protein
VDFSTWFGNNVEWIYGIQMMPITPVSEQLLRPSWLQASHSVWADAVSAASEQWRTFLLMAEATWQPDKAWDAVTKLELYDAGNSQTNTFYWLATRDSTDAPVESPPPPQPEPAAQPDAHAPAASPSAQVTRPPPPGNAASPAAAPSVAPAAAPSVEPAAAPTPDGGGFSWLSACVLALAVLALALLCVGLRAMRMHACPPLDAPLREEPQHDYRAL